MKFHKSAALFLLTLAFPLAASAASPAAELSGLKTFGTAGKQLRVLIPGQEAVLFEHTGSGCLTHMWFGGGWKGCERTRLRIYVDGEADASIDMELFLGHGIGFSDQSSPWGVSRIGKAGTGATVYDTYRIPFGKSIRVTAQLAAGVEERPDFWWIIRGTENLPVELAGVRLPNTARLKLFKLEGYTAQPLEEFALCNVKGDGALYQVTMAAKGLRAADGAGDNWKNLSFMEGCMRAYVGGATTPLILSSGLEDYFLGTYYFNKGLYYTPVAGATHLNLSEHEFSAYRFHEDDPVLFHDGLRLTARCGETVGGQTVGDPPKTEYTTYVWLYMW